MNDAAPVSPDAGRWRRQPQIKERPLEPHELIRKRWSPRAFADRPVEPEKLRALFDAARLAASCFNEQPWRWVIASKDEDPAGYELLFGCLVEKNQRWAASAPTLALTLARKTFTQNGKDNRHALHDAGLAMGNFSVQASALDLFLHQMAGFDRDAARTRLGLPEDLEAVAMLAIGYRGELDRIPEEFHDLEKPNKPRKPLEELVFRAGDSGLSEPASFL